MKTFSEYYEERELTEMARRKKPKMHTPSVKKKSPMIIKGEIGPVGHIPHQSGGGAHSDKRKRRLNTRSAQQRRAIGEQE